MKTVDHAAKLAKLLDRVAVPDAELAAHAWDDPILDPTEPLLNEFLRAFLVWEVGVPAARATAARLTQQIVDFNDLRVCLPHDLAAVLGDADPFAHERAERLRAALTDLFRRTYSVSLEHLAPMAKREARTYLDTLEGVPEFVASRVSLVRLGVHAMPMDQRLHSRLVKASCLPDDSTPEHAADQIQRLFKAGSLLGAYFGLQAWADEQPDDEATTRKPRSRAADDHPPRR